MDRLLNLSSRRTLYGCILFLHIASFLIFLPACSRAENPAETSPSPEIFTNTPPEEFPGELLPPPPLLQALEQSSSLRFGHVTPEKGLSQSVVQDIIQDRQGFLWLATQDGLNRFDGYEFKIFKSDPRSKQGLRGNVVSALALGEEGSIWIGTTDGGLSQYDPVSGQFTRYSSDPDDPNTLSEDSVTDLMFDNLGNLWIGTNNQGLSVLDVEKGIFRRYLNDPADPASISSNHIIKLFLGPQDEIWIATTGGGLNHFNPSSGRFSQFRGDPDDPNSLSEDEIQSLYIDRLGTLWVGTYLGGLHRFDPDSGGFERFPINPNDPQKLGAGSITDIYEDSQGRFWLATGGGGLHLLDRDTGRFTRFQHDPLDPESLSSDFIVKIYEDENGNLWLGMFGSGLDYHDPFSQRFVRVRSEPGNQQGISGNGVWSILVDRVGDLYVGTHGGGISRFNVESQSWQVFPVDPEQQGSLSSSIVFALYADADGNIWLGGDLGIEKFDPQSGRFTLYPNHYVFDIFEDSRGDFWFATSLGLIRAAPQDLQQHYQDNPDEFFPMTFINDPGDPGSISSDAIVSIYEDSSQAIWVGTFNAGLNRFDSHTGKFHRYLHDDADAQSISSNSVLSIYQARDGTLWVGTIRGLNRYNPKTDSFQSFYEEDGLASNTIYGILEDQKGRLWLSTNWGITRFDPAERTFRNYNKRDGLQDVEFNQGAYFLDKSGVMFFGGLKGINAFHPDLVREDFNFPPVAMTGLKIFNQDVEPGEDSPLKGPVESTRAIELDYRDDFFEFTYASLQLTDPDEIQYAYQLVGLDEDWNIVGDRRFATYTNIPPGDYILRVRSTNRDGLWNDRAAEMSISIPPPFWQTTWFRILAVIGIIAAVSSVVMLRIRTIEQRRKLLEVQVEERTQELHEAMDDLASAKEKAEAANKAKSNFLANMSHEFRTPLNAILGFTQLLRRDHRLAPDQKEEIAIINRSSEHLLGLINEVLEMSKIESGHAVLNKNAFDLHRMLAGLGEMFSLRAENKGLSLQVDIAPQVPQYIFHDEGKLRQVMVNLLGNAVKFTDQGHIRMRVSPTSPPMGGDAGCNWLRFSVEDTGMGIEPDEIEKIFNPFEQAKAGQHLQEGTGLGLSISQQFVRLMGGEITVSSQVGSGSIFSFNIPVEAASPDELSLAYGMQRVTGIKPGQPEYRILVVDDNDFNRELIVRILSPLGFELREAVNGQEAWEIWETWEPHLIFLDMRMPVMNGYEITRKIKSTTRGMATVIVALTASALEEDRAVILSEGCDDYIRKPFQEQVLFDALARHLGVEFLYAEEGDQAPEAVLVPSHAVLDSSTLPADQHTLATRLARFGADCLDQLGRAAVLGDLGEMGRLVDVINHADAELGESISQLVEKFEHEKILALVQAARHEIEVSGGS